MVTSMNTASKKIMSSRAFKVACRVGLLLAPQLVLTNLHLYQAGGRKRPSERGVHPNGDGGLFAAACLVDEGSGMLDGGAITGAGGEAAPAEFFPENGEEVGLGGSEGGDHFGKRRTTNDE